MMNAWPRLCSLALLVALVALPLRAADTPPPPDAAAAAFQKLLELDEQVQEQIEQWQASAQTNRLQQDAVSQATLNLKIKQELERLNGAYQSFIKDHPGHVKGRLAYASFLNENDREGEALTQLEEARRLAPENPVVWNNLGNHYGQNGPATNAFICYTKAIALDPKQALYHHNLGRNLYLYHDIAAEHYRISQREVITKAQALYCRALELNPTNFSTATDLAQSYYAIQVPLTGDASADTKAARKLTEEALDAWETALKLARTDEQRQSVHLHRARVQISARRWADARATLAKVTDPKLGSLKAELEVRLTAEEARNKP